MERRNLLTAVLSVSKSFNFDRTRHAQILAASALNALESCVHSPDRLEISIDQCHKTYLDIAELAETLPSMTKLSASEHRGAPAFIDAKSIKQRLSEIRPRLLLSSYPPQYLTGENPAVSDTRAAPSPMSVKKAVEKRAVEILAIDKSEPRPLRHFLDSRANLIVLGDAGSGKSWSVSLYYDQLYEDLKAARSAAAVPVFVTAGAVLAARRPESETEELLEPVETLYRLVLSRPELSWITQKGQLLTWLLRTGSITLLIDGINEVSEGDRVELRDLVERWRATWPLCRYILTTRTFYWKSDQRLFPKWPAVEIVGLRNRDVRELVQKFYKEEDEEESSAALLELLFDRNAPHSVVSLRSNPFFLDKLVRLYRKNKVLPRNRGNLFRDYVEVNISDRTWLPLQKWLLEVLAFYMTTRGQTASTDSLEAKRVLRCALYLAPRDLLREGDKKFLNALPAGAPYHAADTDQVREILAVVTEKNDSFTAEGYSRFKEDPVTIENCFKELLEIIERNKYLQLSAGFALFSHQSFQEYFAAERFDFIYREAPGILDRVIRDKRFDETLHIVVGCIFSDRHDLIRRLFDVLIKRGTDFETVRDCLLKAEYVDAEATNSLKEACWTFLREPTAADGARADALACLTLVDNEFSVESLLLDGDGQEGPELLSQCLSMFHQGNTPVADLMWTIYDAMKLRKFREEPMITLARWARDRNDLNLALALLRVVDDYRFIEDLSVKVIWELWKTLVGMGSLVSWEQWKFFLEAAEDPGFFTSVFSCKHRKIDEFQKRIVNREFLLSTLARVDFRAPGWGKALSHLLEAAVECGHCSTEIIERTIEICRANGEYPAIVRGAVWQADLEAILKSEWDVAEIENRVRHEDYRANAVSGLASCLENATSEEAIATLRRNLENLCYLSWFGHGFELKAFVGVVTRILLACRKTGVSCYWFPEILNLLVDWEDGVVERALARWNTLTLQERRAVCVVVRQHSDRIPDDNIDTFFEEDPSSRFIPLLVMGGGTDRLIAKRPDLITKVSAWSGEHFYQQSVSSQWRPARYSTLISLFANGLGHSGTHPGNPSPQSSPKNWESFEYLLQHGLAREAAYMLVNANVDSVRKELTAHLERAFEKALSHLEFFEESQRKSSTKREDPADVGSIVGIRRALAKPSSIGDFEFRNLLRDVLHKEDGGFELRLEALSKANGWTAAHAGTSDFRVEWFFDLRRSSNMVFEDPNPEREFERIVNRMNSGTRAEISRRLLEEVVSLEWGSLMQWERLALRALELSFEKEEIERPTTETFAAMIVGLAKLESPHETWKAISGVVAGWLRRRDREELIELMSDFGDRLDTEVTRGNILAEPDVIKRVRDTLWEVRSSISIEYQIKLMLGEHLMGGRTQEAA